MTIENIAGVALVLAILIPVLPALRKQWNKDRSGAIKTYGILLAFMIYSVGGILAFVFLVDKPGLLPAGTIANLVALIFAWVLYGSLWLARLVPRYEEPVPAWVDRRGTIDFVFIGLIMIFLGILILQ
jgi:hypothetical protein